MSSWKLAFITGGGSGIGRHMAELLMAEGTSVAVFDRSNSPEAISHLQTITSRHKGVRCDFLLADVTDAAVLSNAVKMVARLAPRV